MELQLKLFKLFPFAKKFVFCTHFSPFFRSVALLCILKKTSIGYKILNFRLNAKSLNDFIINESVQTLFFLENKVIVQPVKIKCKPEFINQVLISIKLGIDYAEYSILAKTYFA